MGRKAHPRRCGADEKLQAAQSDVEGSSPQVRGRSRPELRARAHTRLIPAGAGQIWQTGKYTQRELAEAGSSPQVRGRCEHFRRCAGGCGLIPAGAGQICGASCWDCGRWAHPRRCGADSSSCRQAGRTRGSSPQVRGRFLSRFPTPRAGGLIPAGAGQILPIQSRHLQGGAHPRRCGADLSPHARGRGCRGSSPQVRGRWPTTRWIIRRVRLIPAGAGQILSPLPRAHWYRAHPRRCGADDRDKSTGDAAPGSSPQVRGR